MQPTLFDDEPIVKTVWAGTLVREAQGVLVYRRRVSWVYADTGQEVVLKKPHFIGLCAECHVSSHVLSPDGAAHAIQDARQFCPLFCEREDCPLKENDAN